jgi:VanZ family protein
MGGIFWASHQPTIPMPQSIPHLDKVLHFGAYAGLAGLLVLAIGPAALPGRQRFWLAWGIACLYGLSDEFHQSFVPGRDVSALDWLADAVGALAGAWAGNYILSLGLGLRSGLGTASGSEAGPPRRRS